jgi:hypothetical protein
MYVVDLKKSPTSYLDSWLLAVLERVSRLEEKMAEKDAKIDELERKIKDIIIIESKSEQSIASTSIFLNTPNSVEHKKVKCSTCPSKDIKKVKDLDYKEIKNGQLFDSYQEFQKTFQKLKESTERTFSVSKSSKFKTVKNPKHPYEYQKYKCIYKDCGAGFRISLRSAGKHAGKYIILKSSFEHHSHDNQTFKRKRKNRSLISPLSSSKIKFSKVSACDDDDDDNDDEDADCEEISDYDAVNFESNEEVTCEDYNEVIEDVSLNNDDDKLVFNDSNKNDHKDTSLTDEF